MTANNALKEELKTGKKIIGVWGLGYIGYSSMAYFARAGVNCIGTDVTEHRVDDVNHGRQTIPNMDYWLGFDVKPLAKAGLMKATLNWEELLDERVGVHLVSIPTEKDGKPYHDILEDVITKLCKYKDVKKEHPPLVIIESTLSPNAMDNIAIPLVESHGLSVGEDILIGVAPRRDWFTSPDKNLEKIPRVVGGTTQETTDIMAEVLSIICINVLKAKDHRHSAIVKSIENAYRQLDITLANQLSLAYPDLDMTSILRLVGTKWNIGTYHPSFGTGGYCIPLAPQYVLEGAKHPEALTLLKESLDVDFKQPEKVAKSLIKRGVKNVGILGLSYTSDLKVHILSPAIPIAKALKEAGINVKLQDPYYSADEIKGFVDTETFEFPEGLQEFDAILIVSPHMQYRYINSSVVIENLKECRLILDNMGAWKDVKFPEGIEYHEAGDENWLE
ncbi:MAG: nucleotide sugar dehydrogenase [Candidatus Altiarchaeales archaeon]|nr:nucleotide sugar dehydrogenase [Candidatus Altiarchaeales archaeon]